MAVAALVVLFLVLPLAELYVIFKAADDWFGIGWTIALLAADSVIGALLLRTQGRAVWRRFNEALRAGRMPHQEVQDGVLVIFGGAFLITPGFITDVLGLLMLIPPTRAVIRRLAMRVVRRRVELRVAGAPTEEERRFDVDGTASEYEPPPRELRR